MAQISVKPTRTLMVQAIKDALKNIPAEIEKYEQDLKQYKKDMQAWVKSFDYSPSNIKDSDVREDIYTNKVYGVTVHLKKYPANKPKLPKRPRFDGHYKNHAMEELTRVLRMLELSDEERVTASLANRVIDYI
ncbi:hypothetical protein UFOVP111_4 [uncultured Caudovirales phage]|uniref:Uncharacterized protein n=1 Tax=uncultured Caudovirales phage TaxID=2100421 RepID=A0A6J5L8F9_9CAUD|nr:hypothetical protein UFOVP111_4 [uncultured Caudovirales phage]